MAISPLGISLIVRYTCLLLLVDLIIVPIVGGIISRGPGLSIVEATSVRPEGRITPECPGLWDDSFIDDLRQIVDYAHSQNQKIGIQVNIL